MNLLGYGEKLLPECLAQDPWVYRQDLGQGRVFLRSAKRAVVDAGIMGSYGQADVHGRWQIDAMAVRP